MFQTLQIKQICTASQVALRKGKVDQNKLTAKEIQSGVVENFLTQNKGFNFLKQQRFSPAYYNRLRLDLMAWIRQLGKATFFLTLSMAESKWDVANFVCLGFP